MQITSKEKQIAEKKKQITEMKKQIAEKEKQMTLEMEAKQQVCKFVCCDELFFFFRSPLLHFMGCIQN